jgi:hypothetical protein
LLPNGPHPHMREQWKHQANWDDPRQAGSGRPLHFQVHAPSPCPSAHTAPLLGWWSSLHQHNRTYPTTPPLPVASINGCPRRPPVPPVHRPRRLLSGLRCLPRLRRLLQRLLPARLSSSHLHPGCRVPDPPRLPRARRPVPRPPPPLLPVRCRLAACHCGGDRVSGGVGTGGARRGDTMEEASTSWRRKRSGW